MDLAIQHTFPMSPRAFWDLTNDPTYIAHTDRVSGVTRETLEERVEPDGRRYLRARWTSRERLPALVAKVVGADHLTYELIQHIDDERMRLEWEIIPPISAGRFTGSGVYVVEAAPGGCVRRVDGRIKVDVPLVGRKIEERVAEEVERGYQRAAEGALAWHREHGAGT